MYEPMAIFVVAFVLMVGAGCALLVLRSLGNLELPGNPPFPLRRSTPHRHFHPAAEARVNDVETAHPELAEKN